MSFKVKGGALLTEICGRLEAGALAAR